jgi:hypothetical protein
MQKSPGVVLVVLLSLANTAVQADEDWFACQPTEVTVFANRAHIRCEFSFGESTRPSYVLLFGDPRFFAVPASDERLTAAAVTLGQAAITSGRSILIAFDYFGSTGDAYGCQLNDCRPIRALRLKK